MPELFAFSSLARAERFINDLAVHFGTKYEWIASNETEDGEWLVAVRPNPHTDHN